MAPVKKGLSYVLGYGSPRENHILPINAIQYSSVRGQLVTGGRDGLVKVWNTPKLDQTSSDLWFSSEDEEPEDLDERLLKLETAISSNPLRYLDLVAMLEENSTKSYNIHFDWINDLKLVNNDRHAVTALADLSLKLIDLDGGEGDVLKFENFHTDYVKKLSAIAPQDLVISGGLDGNVAIWDLRTLRPIQSFTNISANSNLPTSIYSLSNDHANLISTGGPSNTINIYDRRISSQGNENLIRKLVGHQDNVRCLLMNSNFILSGSTDTTVKLWDLRNFKVYKNFDFHEDAVWSLCTASSSSPSESLMASSDLNVFYSGDKSGNIIKTDLSRLSDNHLHDSKSAQFSESSYTDERIGVSTLVAKTDSPIVSLGVECDKSVFASTYTSLQRYHVPKTDQLTEYQYLRTKLDYLANIETQLDDDISGGMKVSPSDKTDLDSDFYDIVSHLSMDSNNLEIQSSLSVPKYGNPFDVKSEESTGEYYSMFFTDDELPFNFVNVFKDEEPSTEKFEEKAEAVVDTIPVEISLNPIPPADIVTIPFNKYPFQELKLSPKSIIAKRILNNKRMIFTLCLNGDITIWDLLVCKERKVFSNAQNNRPLTKDELKERTEKMESLFQEYQTMDTLNDWCEVEIKSGKLFVSLVNPLVNDVEVYYDELVRDYPYLAYEKSQNGKGYDSSIKVTIDDRFLLCRIFLNSLLRNYSLYEWKADQQLRTDLVNYRSKSRPGTSPLDDDSLSVASGDDTPRRPKSLFRKSSRIVPTQHSVKLSMSSITSVTSNLSDVTLDNTTDGASISDDSISKLLLLNKKLYIEFFNTHGSKKALKTSLRLYTNDPELQAAKPDDEKYKPLIPLSVYSKELLIIIAEKSQDLGNYRDLCSFHVEDLVGLTYPPANEHNRLLVNQLRNGLPKWIGQPILYDRYVHKEAPKLTFHLMEMDYSQLPPDKKIGGKSQKKIKRLPLVVNSTKLVSQNMLRVNKILYYVTEKFDTRTSEMKEKRNPLEWLALECRGQELQGNMTLQTIRTKIWKSSGDIELRFRRKFDA